MNVDKAILRIVLAADRLLGAIASRISNRDSKTKWRIIPIDSTGGNTNGSAAQRSDSIGKVDRYAKKSRKKLIFRVLNSSRTVATHGGARGIALRHRTKKKCKA